MYTCIYMCWQYVILYELYVFFFFIKELFFFCQPSKSSMCVYLGVNKEETKKLEGNGEGKWG